MTDVGVQATGLSDVTAEEPQIPDPSGWSDALTGTDGPRYWDRVLASEQARMRRHGGSATVVLVEFAGFGEERIAWVGLDSVLQAFARVSRVLAGEIRSSDHIARIGPTRFGILLIATDEVRTLNFVDRVLRACRRELEVEPDPIRIGLGWASPGANETLAQAMATAEARLEADFFRTQADPAGR